jgi:serine/threonine protein kinase
MEMETRGDNLARGHDPSLREEIASIYQETSVPEDRWDIQQSTDAAKLWFIFNCQPVGYTEQGWKLHISAHPSSAIVVLHRVLGLLLQARAPFKVAASLQALRTLNEGLYGWSQIGKFITIYPSSEAEAVELASLLDEHTHALTAPKIPSDRPLYPGSLVHYRYGSFSSSLMMQEQDGIISPAIRTPTNAFIPDRRKNHYEAPGWCSDPFVKAGISRESIPMKRMLDRRYLLVGIMTASPAHTLYLAGDLQAARSCVIKGPGIFWEQGTVDESINQALYHEAEILRTLASVAQVPACYACLEQDGSVFLVLEDITGEPFTEYVKRLRDQGQQITPGQALDWGKQIATILSAIHQQKLVYADLKSSNIIIDREQRLHLIDFELTDQQGSCSLGTRGTRGYSSLQRQAGLPLDTADDIYSLGCLMYFIVTGAEPSEAPNVEALLARQPAWFSAAGALLQDLIWRCLSPSPKERYTSMQAIVDELNAMEARLPELALVLDSTRASSPEDTSVQETVWRHFSQELLQTISAVAQRGSEQQGIFWSSAHPVSYGLIARDINTGNAGTLLALAELVAAYPEMGQRSILAESARWMQHAPLIYGQPLPGLYIGEAGVGAALLRAGQILHDDTLIRAASERGRLVASLPYASPDLFHGTAGRLRFHLWLWDETGEEEHLHHAITCGRHLLASALSNEQREIFWTIPEGYHALSGQTYPGYAHGAAGIADALLDLFEATGDECYIATIQGAADWLKRQAVAVNDDKTARLWPKREHEPPAAPFWCHGGTGIGQFLLHLSRHTFFSDAGELAAQAACAIARGTGWADATQCHGLSGNIEFLLDMYQGTGEHSYRAQAFSLARCLAAFAQEQKGLRVFPSEIPTIFTPDYMVGYAGVAMCALRLAEPEQRPGQLTRQGFRYTLPGVLS